MHVHISVSAEPPEERNVFLFERLRPVILQQLFVCGQAFWVKGNIMLGRFFAELFEANCAFVLFPGGKMFVFGDPCIWDFRIAIIHYGGSLVIAFGVDRFECDSAVAEPSELIIEEVIDRSREENMIVGSKIFAGGEFFV